ncbi:MAG TPA: hypothetical protein VIF62_05530 [Labilithrix sp.]
MFVVAIAALGRPVDQEILPLASDIGVTPYEAGLLLRGAMPIVALRTDDKARAIALLGQLRARGHDAVAVDVANVISSDAMTPIRAFRFDGEALVVLGANAVETPVAYAEIVAILRAMHIARTESVEKEKRNVISIGRAVMTGGVVATKSVERETVKRSEDREPVIYIFRRDGAPCLLRANHARYDGLGPELRATANENVQTFIRVLRAHAPNAALDERLLAVKAADTRQLDILASVLATSIARQIHAYRGT